MALYPLLPNPSPQFCDANGDPYAAGTIDTYVPDTTTPKDTWLDPAGAALNTNPIILDSAGRCVMHGDGLYRLVLKDADGNLVFDLPSSTLVSAAMAPVIMAPTIADALDLLGVTDAIDAAVAIETARAENAELTEILARAAEDTIIVNALNAEIARAEAAEAANAAAIAAETARAEAAEAAIAAVVGAAAETRTGSSTADINGRIMCTFSPAFPSACTNVTFGPYPVSTLPFPDIVVFPPENYYSAYTDAAGDPVSTNRFGVNFPGYQILHLVGLPGEEVGTAVDPGTVVAWTATGY